MADSGAYLEDRFHMTTESLQWRTDLDAALAEARTSGKLVLLDFSAAPM